MLKTRIIPTLLYKDYGLIKDKQFKHDRGVGPLLQTVKVYNLRQIDELVILDIQATPKSLGPNCKIIEEIAPFCFVPLTVGGGIKTLSDVKEMLRSGADKVLINTALYNNLSLAKEVVTNFGSQCLVAGIDVTKDEKGQYYCVSNCGTTTLKKDPITWAKQLEKTGVGEIFIVNIAHDGMMKGYDLEVIKKITSAVNIPVIASGGCGSYKDMETALKSGASAVAAASIFHFTQQTPLKAKEYLKTKKFNVRITKPVTA